MGLAQDIVIRNEFSIPRPGGGGSRGGTPGRYVRRYMAREQATEPITPIRSAEHDDLDGFVRYMTREDATEHAPLTADLNPDDLLAATGEGGVAFGSSGVSLSGERLRADSAAVQQAFDNGATVLKTVLSFTDDWLRGHKVLPDDHVQTAPGDQRGKVDQLKLRRAVIHGMDLLGRRRFDDPLWIGTIQVDTRHTHVHLAIVDTGIGRRHSDGTQRGMLDKVDKTILRRGIDSWLERHHQVQHWGAMARAEQRTTTGYVKRHAFTRLAHDALPQLMIAALPGDRRLWRMGSNDRRMRKANRLMAEWVTDVLDSPDSPLPVALRAISDAAARRAHRESLDRQAWRDLVEAGHRDIIERAGNGVYRLISTWSDTDLATRTPTLHVMSLDHDHLLQLMVEKNRRHDPSHGGHDSGEDLVDFAYRMRSYRARWAHHRDQAQRHRRLVDTWADDAARGAVTPDAEAIARFYQTEQAWHEGLCDKYQWFLPLVVTPLPWEDERTDLDTRSRHLWGLRALRADLSLGRMGDPQAAEKLGQWIYGVDGGADRAGGAEGNARLEARIAAAESDLRDHLAQVTDRLAAAKLRPHSDDGRTWELRPVLEHRFDDVKGWDLHHLTWDFTGDQLVGARTADRFVAWAQRRRTALDGAMGYLEATGQSERIADLPVGDVAKMTAMARLITDSRRDDGTAVLPSSLAHALERDRAAGRADDWVGTTVALGAPGLTELDDTIRHAAQPGADVTAASPGMSPLETGPGTGYRLRNVPRYPGG